MSSDKHTILNKPIPFNIINDNSLQGPIFHPGEPSSHAWKAGNYAASQYQGILSVWTNMVCYFNKSQTEHGHAEKLQIKSGICELKTLIDILPQIHHMVTSHPICNNQGLKPLISITQDELDNTRKLYKNVNIEKGKTIKVIQRIRNNIGSHFSDAQLFHFYPENKKNSRSSRTKISWNEVESLWQSLEIKTFFKLIKSIQVYLDFINTLSIYEWYRHESNGIIRTHIPCVGKIDEDGKVNIYMLSESMMDAISRDSNNKNIE